MLKITNISGEFFSTTEQPLTIYINNDLNFDTPKSSLYTKKKQLFSSLNMTTIDNQDNKVIKNEIKFYNFSQSFLYYFL